MDRNVDGTRNCPGGRELLQSSSDHQVRPAGAPLSRRTFIRRAGTGAIAITGAAMVGSGVSFRGSVVAAAPKGKPTIGYIQFATFNTYAVQFGREAASFAAAHKAEMNFVTAQANGDIGQQAFLINDMVAKGVKAIVFEPLSETALVAPIKRALQRGIAVVTVNATVNTPVTTQIVESDFEFGHIGGAFLRKALNGKGQIVALRGLASSSISINRWKGVRAALAGSSIKVVDQAFCAWDQSQGKQAMSTMLAAYPSLAGIYSEGGAMSEGAIEAEQAAGRKILPITGEGSNGFLKVWTKLRISSVAPSEPTYSSAVGVEAALHIAQGKKVPRVIAVPLVAITDANLHQYARPGCSDSLWVPTYLSKGILHGDYGCPM